MTDTIKLPAPGSLANGKVSVGIVHDRDGSPSLVLQTFDGDDLDEPQVPVVMSLTEAMEVGGVVVLLANQAQQV